MYGDFAVLVNALTADLHGSMMKVWGGAAAQLKFYL